MSPGAHVNLNVSVNWLHRPRVLGRLLPLCCRGRSRRRRVCGLPLLSLWFPLLPHFRLKPSPLFYFQVNVCAFEISPSMSPLSNFVSSEPGVLHISGHFGRSSERSWKPPCRTQIHQLLMNVLPPGALSFQTKWIHRLIDPYVHLHIFCGIIFF